MESNKISKGIKGRKTDIVVSTNDAKLIYLCALKYGKKLYLNELAYAIVNIGDAKWIYEFTRKFEKHLKNKTINKLTDALIKSEDMYYICLFAMNINKVNHTKMLKSLRKAIHGKIDEEKREEFNETKTLKRKI